MAAIFVQYIRKRVAVMIAWILLLFAIVMEVSGTTCMKLSQGFTQLWPSILVFVFYAFSFTASTFALKTIDVSIAYAVWMALGTTIIAIIGLVLFHESLTPLKVIALITIITGVVLLNLSSSQCEKNW